MTNLTTVQETKQKITAWLDELPSQSLAAVELFVEFLRHLAHHQQTLVVAEKEALPYLYPTVENPTSSLSAWLNVIPGGCGGDALADTAALYDEG